MAPPRKYWLWRLPPPYATDLEDGERHYLLRYVLVPRYGITPVVRALEDQLRVHRSGHAHDTWLADMRYLELSFGPLPSGRDLGGDPPWGRNPRNGSSNWSDPRS